jgi:cytochrome b subunit of formate dehydrogenase
MNTQPVMQRPPHYVLNKIVRVSSWPLFLVVLIFLLTGYAMSGQYGLGAVIDAKRALAIHKMLHGPLLVLLLVHSLPAMYLAFKRWGWINMPE